MKRVLFVDDEPEILEGLEDMLRRHRDEWAMRFALGPQVALEELHRGSFDVVVTDMRMPGMDGAQLLARVREEQPDAIRIILSGHTEEEAAIRAIPVAHQFLAKPCKGEQLKQVIDRTCRLRDLLADEALRSTVTGLGELPSPPQVCAELSEVLVNPDATFGDIAAVIAKDTAMCAKTLQLVNSAFFGLGREIVDVSQAVSYLGLSTVRTLALSLAVFKPFSGQPGACQLVESHQHHAVLTARLAAGIANDEDAFLAGMLHDIGKLVLAVCRPGYSARIDEAAPREQRITHQAERGEMGFSHAEVGAYLLSLWGLPYPAVEAAAFHHAPSSAGSGWSLAGAVHVADALLHEIQPSGAWTAELDLGYLEHAGVASCLSEWRRLAADIGRAPEET